MQKSQSGSIIGGIFKFIGLMFLVVAILLTIAYCYLRFSMGIDIFDIKKKLDLLRAPVTESEVVTNPYEDQNAVDGFNIMFGTNTIYQDNGDGYEFNKQEFVLKEITADVQLSQEQFASILNLFLNNLYQNLNDEFYKHIELKQVSFSNLKVTAETTSADVTVVAKIDFLNAKENISNSAGSVGSFLSGLFPNSIYFTGNFTVSIDNANPDTVTTQSNFVKLNKLTEEETSQIFGLFNKLTGEEEFLSTTINETFATIMFGDNQNDGLVDVISGCGYFTFEQVDENICISLKKA